MGASVDEWDYSAGQGYWCEGGDEVGTTILSCDDTLALLSLLFCQVAVVGLSWLVYVLFLS